MPNVIWHQLESEPSDIESRTDFLLRVDVITSTVIENIDQISTQRFRARFRYVANLGIITSAATLLFWNSQDCVPKIPKLTLIPKLIKNEK